jgi:hypothetical protein
VVPVLVGCGALGGDGAVAGDQLIQDGGLERGLAVAAGGGCGVAGVQQQAGHLGGPFLGGGPGVVHVLQVAQQVRVMPISA